VQYLRESKDPTAKTVIFEDSAALIGIVVATTGLLLTDYQVGGAAGAYWDGVASITIGLVLAVVAFVLARSSRGCCSAKQRIRMCSRRSSRRSKVIPTSRRWLSF
jgi:hypothetical protein